MAVAAHVGKVSKDYSPYGYSIMETTQARVVSAPNGSTINTDGFEIVLMVDDAPIFIEKIQIVGKDAIAASDVNYVTIAVKSKKDGGGSVKTHGSVTTKTTGSGGIGAIADDVFYDIPVDMPVVNSGRIVVISVTKSVAAHASINDKMLDTVAVRYRRKA